MTKRLTLLVLLMLTAFPAMALAQPQPVDPSTSPFEWYSSVTGVVAATILGVSILKRALANVNGLNGVPTWLYAVVMSAVLTFLTNRVWGTLPGELWQLMVQVVMMAAAASGFYEWLNNSTTTSLKSSARKAGVAVEGEV